MINDRFIIKRKLGEGRSKVFLCNDTDNPGIDYAIKILPANASAEEIKSFRNEFFTLQNLNHPNIIISYEDGTIVKTDDENGIKIGSRFIILEFFDGTELLSYKKIKHEQTLNFILKEICSVLYYLHQSNYIYYDLKPENILVIESGEKPVIKFIDVGFTHHLSYSNKNISRGTREYIAPEILKKETQNHQVDLYSFGMLLYRIIYGRFPFTSDAELQIYREQIENEFEFPEAGISGEVLGIVKKLLEKNPVNRFDNSLQILKSINVEVDQDTVKHFTPANIFADRSDIVLQIENFFRENINKEVIVLSGAEGSGKTALLYKLYSDFEKIVLISNTGRENGISFIQSMLKKIIYSDFIYSNVDKKINEKVGLIFSGTSENLIDNIKSIITGISFQTKFNLIIDDFNLLDEFSLDVFGEILPILQVNGINIILSQRTDYPDAAEKIIKKFRVINLSPFTEDELNEYLDIAFVTFFPKDQLKKMIIKYSDLLPGSIINFIRDLILLKIIKFNYDGAEIDEDGQTEKLLESSNEDIFKLRFSLLSDEEIKLAQFISAFGKEPEITIVSGFCKISFEGVSGILKSLKEKNILQVSHIENEINFTSESLKKYVYSTIENKEAYHQEVADYISRNHSDFNRNELARQYELSKQYSASYEILLKEIEEAESAYSYKKNLLTHLLELPLPSEYRVALKYKLAVTLSRLNDSKSALAIIDDSLKELTDKNIKDEFLILKGSCLIELGEFAEGRDLLINFVKEINNEERKQKIRVEIAYAEFDLGKYEASEDFVKKILESEAASLEEKAKCHNLQGLIEIYLRNDLTNALKEFEQSLEHYKQINSVLQEAKLERNIGNIFNMKGDHTNAEKYWNSAHIKNLSIGNLDQEAKHLLNYGIYYYELADYDNALKQYNQAAEIFSVLGNRQGEGLAHTNLGEISTDICNYSEALNSLNTARDIFNNLNIIEEEAEVMFLLGKLFSIVGDEEQLKKIIIEYKERTLDSSERHKNNIRLLEYILGNNSDIEIIKAIKIKYHELNDYTNYAKANIIHCESLITDCNFIEAFNVINEEEFLQFCSKNRVIQAYREFLIGEISMQSEKSTTQNPLKNYTTAYEVLKDNYVSELTWNVMLKLGEIYIKRGNYIKAEEFIIYAKKLIYFIADHITDINLREKYLKHIKRETAVEKLNFLEKELSP